MGKWRCEFRADGFAAIQKDLAAGDDLAMDGAGDDIARRQFRIGMDAQS